jgi:IS4 transposase
MILLHKPMRKETHVNKGQTIFSQIIGFLPQNKFFDSEKNNHLTFLTNQFTLPPSTIAELCRYRWRVEIFFKWIKQHLRIKKFFDTSENAVKTQIWIAVSTYVLVAIMKKRLKIDSTLYTILQVLSLSLFEKMPVLQALTADHYKNEITIKHIQLNLFES